MNELNIFFTDTETTSSSQETVGKETEGAVSPEAMEGVTVSPEAMAGVTASPEAELGDAPVLTIGAMEEGEDMVLLAADSAALAETTTETTAATQANLGFEPMNFVDNLQYMGIGMLTIFLIIGVIIVATQLINKIFSGKKDEE